MYELNNCNTAIVNVDNSSYAFDENTYEILKLTQNTKQIFDYIIKNRALPDDPRLTRELLSIVLRIKQGQFFTEKKVQYGGLKETDSYILSFPIKHMCNLRCKYCFAKGGEVYKGIKKEMQDGIVRNAFNYLRKNTCIKKARVEFVSGGEPFIDKERFREIVSTMKEEESANGISLDIFVETNGTLLDREIIDYVQNNGINLGLSIDGSKEIHDFQRPYASGGGTYDDIVRNISKFVKSNNLWVLSVITNKTECLSNILEHHMNMGFRSIEMRVVRGKDEFGLSLSDENYNHFCRLYSDFSDYLKGNTDKIKYIMNNYDTFGKILVRLITKNKVIYRCQAGRSKFSITADGDVYPCDSFVGHDEMKMGNITKYNRDENVCNYFKDNSVMSNTKCKECLYKFLCGGECYYDQYIMQGDEEHDKLYCSFQKFLIGLAIDLVYYLTDKHQECYNLLRKIGHIRLVQEID